MVKLRTGLGHGAHSDSISFCRAAESESRDSGISLEAAIEYI
jgi:hypothetical protein